MKRPPISPPMPPAIGLSLGVTGHRSTNAVFSLNRSRIEQALNHVFDLIGQAKLRCEAELNGIVPAQTRVHALMVDGVDQIAAGQALARNWKIVAPLPFGEKLNTAINAQPETHDDARHLLTGDGPCSPDTLARAQAIDSLTTQASVFALADQDDQIARLFLDKLQHPTNAAKAQAYSFAASARVELAARIMIEQSDFMIGVWDGSSTNFVGGTGHTIALALRLGAPVVWIDVRNPEAWSILYTSESLARAGSGSMPAPDRETDLARLVHNALKPGEGHKQDGYGAKRHGDAFEGQKALDADRWRPRSSLLWHAYRRVEALFGAESWGERLRNLRQTYETPETILTGSAAPQIAQLVSVTHADPDFSSRVTTEIWRRFAWADGISSRLSDSYRGGMVLNFLFSAFAIVGGIAYLPFASTEQKWIFAVFELALLASILGITFWGQKRRWHGRWFETRRVAEYFRHAPILLSLGVARPAGRWPRGAHTCWPEYYARHGWRMVGLPHLHLDQAYLRASMEGLMKPHVVQQRDYHRGKAKRLAKIHHRLDKFSEVLFTLAVVSVSVYLSLKLGGTLHILEKGVAAHASKLLTFLGVLLPTFGGAIAGIRFFGDFERFSAISDITAEKLDAIDTRIDILLAAPDFGLDYGRVADLANETDEIVISEIESWQAVFGGKHITVPV